MSNVLFISLAGIAGVLLRYFISSSVDQRLGSSFPWGTLIVNLFGCFVAGCVFQLMFERPLAGGGPVDPRLRNAVMVGFLGGFTTFSAYSLQTLVQLQEGQWTSAALNVSLSNLGGIALAWMGYSLMRVWQ